VSSIDQITPNTGGEAQYVVNYHYGLSLPDWADTAEIKTAFPAIAAKSSGAAATATLVKSNGGWQVQNVSPSAGGVQPQ
jgi:hypothetical protein